MRSKRALFQKKLRKRKVVKKQLDDPGSPGSSAARKKNEKQCRVQKKRKRRGTERGRPCVEDGQKDDCTTRRW